MPFYAPSTDLDLKQNPVDSRRNPIAPPVRQWRLLSSVLTTMVLWTWLSGMPVRGEASRPPADTRTQDPVVAVPKVSKSDPEWRRLLTPEQFRILRQAGTETPFENQYHDHKESGNYVCAACGNRLFSSSAKFDSGTGWPSFFKPIDRAAVAERPDNTLFTKRTEVICRRCDGHLGHVFEDGPPPTGRRYCLNSAALTFFAD